MEGTRHGGAQEKQPAENGCVTVVFALEKAAATVPQREREQEGASRSRRTICFYRHRRAGFRLCSLYSEGSTCGKWRRNPCFGGEREDEVGLWIGEVSHPARVPSCFVGNFGPTRKQRTTVFGATGCDASMPTARVLHSTNAEIEAFPVTSFVKEKDRVMTTRPRIMKPSLD